MNLSKVYRGEEAGELKEFRFCSFGDTEPARRADGDSFSVSGLIDSAASKPAALVEQQTDLSIARQVEEAYARGRQEGLAMAEQRFDSASQTLTQALEDVSRLRESLAQTGSRDMLRLVMAIAEQVIRRSIEADPAVVLAIIENALQASVRADSYRISINPTDLESVARQKPLFLASISGLKNLSFDADPSIAKGGCRVDSELGNVDATIETQLENIRAALCEAIAEG